MTAVSLNNTPATPGIAAASGQQCASGGCTKTANATTGVASDVSQSTGAADTAAIANPQQSSLQSSLHSALATLRRALSAVSDLGRWLDHVGSAAVAAMHAVAKQHTGIEIHTQEGDVIRIDYTNRFQADVQATQASGSDSSVSAQQVSASQSERLRVSVQGNLNADELQAVNDVLGKIDSLANDFYAGNLDAAFAHASAIKIDSQQLADVAVQFNQSQRVSVEAASTESLPASTNAPGAIASSTASTPVSTVPQATERTSEGDSNAAASQSIKPTNTEIDAPASSPNVPAPPAQTTASAPASAGQSQAALAAATTKSIVEYVAKLTSSLRVNDRELQLGLSLQTKLNVLMASIQSKQPNAGSPNTVGVDKLADVAQKAVALAA